jgi:putative oxidoreductase
MSSHVGAAQVDRARSREAGQTSEATRYAVPLGRAAFAAIFLFAALGHFSQETISYAAGQGVPLAGVAVPVSGVLSLLGGLSVLLGYRARAGAWLLVLFLVPVTVMLHNFWAVTDPEMRQMQLIMFLKNVSMLGGALLVAHFGAGPISLDRRAGRP